MHHFIYPVVIYLFQVYEEIKSHVDMKLCTIFIVF